MLSAAPSARVRLGFTLLATIAALAASADYLALAQSHRQAKVRPAELTPRQVILGWFAAWNANDAHKLCSFYGKDLLAHLGGDIDGCAQGYGKLVPQRFQIASFEREGDYVTVGVIAGTKGGAVYIAPEEGHFKIVGFSG